MRTIGLALAFSGWLATPFAALGQGVEVQTPPFLVSHYSTGPVSRQVTISTRAGQVLTLLDVPAEVALSIHLIKGEFTQPNDRTSAVTFSGDVSIRTLPRSELVEGASREQMMKAPLRLDVQDALVVLTPSR